MRQLVITPSMGKLLIGRATAQHPALQQALTQGTVAIIAGTTNGYVAEEVLAQINQKEDFSPDHFFRGRTLPPGEKTKDTAEKPFPGDVIITNGDWQKGKTIFDVIDDLDEGDVILKGANALDMIKKQAAVLIGHPQGGTIAAALQAVIGKRVRLLLPVGLEKRVGTDLNKLANLLNQPGAQGPRLYPVPSGEIITEIEAIEQLTGVNAELTAGGGVNGAEGAVWLAVSGSEEDENNAAKLISSLI